MEHGARGTRRRAQGTGELRDWRDELKRRESREKRERQSNAFNDLNGFNDFNGLNDLSNGQLTTDN